MSSRRCMSSRMSKIQFFYKYYDVVWNCETMVNIFQVTIPHVLVSKIHTLGLGIGQSGFYTFWHMYPARECFGSRRSIFCYPLKKGRTKIIIVTINRELTISFGFFCFLSNIYSSRMYDDPQCELTWDSIFRTRVGSMYYSDLRWWPVRNPVGIIMVSNVHPTNPGRICTLYIDHRNLIWILCLI